MRIIGSQRAQLESIAWVVQYENLPRDEVNPNFITLRIPHDKSGSLLGAVIAVTIQIKVNVV